MQRTDSREYLGAYASGTLLPAEERRLHEAALEDQELFNALADEVMLREALADLVFRQRLKRRLRRMDEGFAWRLAAESCRLVQATLCASDGRLGCTRAVCRYPVAARGTDTGGSRDALQAR